MTSPRALPLLLLGSLWLACVPPAAAQHPGGGTPGGGRGGIAAPVGGAGHPGFAAPSHGGPAARQGASAGLQSFPAARGNAYGSSRSLFPAPGITSTQPVTYTDGIARFGEPARRGGGERERRSRAGAGFVNLAYPGYPGVGYLGSGYPGPGYDSDLLDSTENPNPVPAGYGPGPLPSPLPDGISSASPYEQPGSPEADGNGSPDGDSADNAPPSYVRAPRHASAPAQVPPPAPAPLPEEDAVTILFKDGRPPEQIRNYALTRTALYITTGRVRTIPIDQIDLPATEKINEKAGVDFHLPSNR